MTLHFTAPFRVVICLSISIILFLAPSFCCYVLGVTLCQLASKETKVFYTTIFILHLPKAEKLNAVVSFNPHSSLKGLLLLLPFYR